ncbi:hypothetical protein QJ48_06580 [Paenibacillus sp. A3]|nr:hypothetical protein QJ48_06580 [Paenibacillus sp. A3]
MTMVYYVKDDLLSMPNKQALEPTLRFEGLFSSHDRTCEQSTGKRFSGDFDEKFWSGLLDGFRQKEALSHRNDF